MALVEAKIRQSIVSEEPLLHDIARYVIEAGGKRIRPMVTLLAFRALGGTDAAQAIDLAAALELIHSATLITTTSTTAARCAAGARPRTRRSDWRTASSPAAS